MFGIRTRQVIFFARGLSHKKNRTCVPHPRSHHTTTQQKKLQITHNHNTPHRNTTHHITPYHNTAHHTIPQHSTSHNTTTQHITQCSTSHNTAHTPYHNTPHHTIPQHSTSHHCCLNNHPLSTNLCLFHQLSPSFICTSNKHANPSVPTYSLI